MGGKLRMDEDAHHRLQTIQPEFASECYGLGQRLCFLAVHEVWGKSWTALTNVGRWARGRK